MVFVLSLNFFILHLYSLQNLEILRCFFQSYFMIIITKVQLVFEIKFYHLVSIGKFLQAFETFLLNFISEKYFFFSTIIKFSCFDIQLIWYVRYFHMLIFWFKLRNQYFHSEHHFLIFLSPPLFEQSKFDQNLIQYFLS